MKYTIKRRLKLCMTPPPMANETVVEVCELEVGELAALRVDRVDQRAGGRHRGLRADQEHVVDPDVGAAGDGEQRCVGRFHVKSGPIAVVSVYVDVARDVDALDPVVTRLQIDGAPARQIGSGVDCCLHGP